MEQSLNVPINSGNRSFNWNDFLSFRMMITFHIIRIVYVIIAVLITLVGFIAVFKESSSYSPMPSGPMMGLAIIIFGNLLWRIWCELIIVFFRINNSLTDIDTNTRNK